MTTNRPQKAVRVIKYLQMQHKQMIIGSSKKTQVNWKL